MVNNKIFDTSVTIRFGIHLDKRLNFESRIKEVSLKVTKSIILLYIKYCHLPETILKALYILYL